MDRKWFVSNILRLLIWSNICGSLLVSSYKIPGFLEDNIINDGNFLTNELIQGNENDGGTIINGVVNDDKHDDYDSKEQNGDDKLIRSHENELPLEPRSRGRKRSNVLLLEHLSNLTEIDKDPRNQTIREIFINSEDYIRLFDNNEDDDDEEEEGEDEDDDYEMGFETSLQRAQPRSILHLNLLNPHNFLSQVLSENHSKELVRTKRQTQGGRRRRRCRCGRRRGRRRRRRRRRNRSGAQSSSRRRRGGGRRRRGRRRCVCRGRGAGGGSGGGGGGEGEGGGGEGGGEMDGGGGDEGEGGGEEEAEGGGEEAAEEGGEEDGGGGDEEEGAEEVEGSSEVSGEDVKSDEESDEKSEESNKSSDESDEKED